MASYYDKSILSDSDLERIKQLGDEWAKANDTELKSQLHNAAESIRGSYGYSGGEDGSKFISTDAGLYAASSSASDYRNALADAETARQAGYADQLAQAEVDASERLRDAYAKNMQSKLGLDQTLRASGISGGASESILASADNNYNNVRDTILSETDAAKREIRQAAAESKSDSDTDIAKLGYESALDRADRASAAEQRDYDREQDTLNRGFQNEQFEYQKEQDALNRQYQQEQDALDRQYQQEQFEYQKAQDAREAAQASASRAASASNNQVSTVLKLMQNGYYSDSFKDILGVPDLEYTGDGAEDAQSAVWKMLSNGVYHDSFPEIVGFPDTILKEYAENVKYGY